MQVARGQSIFSEKNMENSNHKYITICFVGIGICTAYVISVIMETLSRTWILFARYLQGDLIIHGLPVTLGIMMFLLLQFNPRIVQRADEVIVEVQKVVWPSKKDTMGMTIVVTIMLIISGILLGLFDLISSYVVNYMVSM